MTPEVDFRQTEKVLSKAQELLSSIRDARFSWPNRENFAADLETASTLLSEMRAELSKLVSRLSEHGDVVHGQGQDSDVIDGINKAYSLLSHLHDDVRAVERAETTGKAVLVQRLFVAINCPRGSRLTPKFCRRRTGEATNFV